MKPRSAPTTPSPLGVPSMQESQPSLPPLRGPWDTHSMCSPSTFCIRDASVHRERGGLNPTFPATSVSHADPWTKERAASPTPSHLGAPALPGGAGPHPLCRTRTAGREAALSAPSSSSEHQRQQGSPRAGERTRWVRLPDTCLFCRLTPGQHPLSKRLLTSC